MMKTMNCKLDNCRCMYSNQLGQIIYDLFLTWRRVDTPIVTVEAFRVA